MTITSRKSLIAIGAATFFAGVLLLFPARVAYDWFVPATVRLNGVQGSVWNGKVMEGLAGGVYFTNLSWSFKPLALFTGKAVFDTSINTAGGPVSMTFGVGPSGTLSMKDVVGNLSLSAIHPALQANRIDGMLNIQLQSLIVKNGWPTELVGSVGVGNLVAGDLGPDSLGNFRAEFTTEDHAIVGVVQDAGAVLNVTGTINLTDDRAYSLIGFVSPNSETPPGINRNLRFLGSPDQNGQRQFRFEGAL
jgi:general secretion pathway protein N